MGRQRAASPEETTPQEDEAIGVIAAILAGSIALPNPALGIAEVLVNLVPGFFPLALRADISAEVARLVVQDPPGPPNGSQARLVASRDNLGYRAKYGIAAVRRLVKAVRGPGEEGANERLVKALRIEASYLEAHQNAAKRRTEQAGMLDRAMTLYGPVLSWHSVIRESSRPHHAAADKQNFDARTIPSSTGAYPGVLSGCLCTFGPPIPGARTLK